MFELLVGLLAVCVVVLLVLVVRVVVEAPIHDDLNDLARVLVADNDITVRTNWVCNHHRLLSFDMDVHNVLSSFSIMEKGCDTTGSHGTAEICFLFDDDNTIDVSLNYVVLGKRATLDDGIDTFVLDMAHFDHVLFRKACAAFASNSLHADELDAA